MSLGAAMAGGNPTTGRQDDDFYPTPWEVTAALMQTYPSLANFQVWEPCAGDAAMTREIEKVSGPVVSTDLHPRDERVTQADFLTADMPAGCRAIITNPPFNLAERMIERALGFAEQRFVALVLKSTYWHAKGRQALFARCRPTVVHPLTWRPDFLGLGRPTMEVMWCVWIKGGPAHTLYKPLNKPT